MPQETDTWINETLIYTKQTITTYKYQRCFYLQTHYIDNHHEFSNKLHTLFKTTDLKDINNAHVGWHELRA